MQRNKRMCCSTDMPRTPQNWASLKERDCSSSTEMKDNGGWQKMDVVREVPSLPHM